MTRRSHGWIFAPRHILQLCNQPPQGPYIPQKLPLSEARREPPTASPSHQRLFSPLRVWNRRVSAQQKTIQSDGDQIGFEGSCVLLRCGFTERMFFLESNAQK